MQRLGMCALLLVLLLAACGGPSQEEAKPAKKPATSTVDVHQGETEQSEVLAEPYWDKPLEKLVAGDGYGKLVPYRGRKLQPDTDQDTAGLDLYWYGLATTDGRVVTAPVYALAEQLRYVALDGNETPMPMYQLWTEKFWESDALRLCAVAALDGSWCTEQCYLWAGAVGPDRALLMDQDYRLWFCDLEGHVTPTAVDHPITDLWNIVFPDSMYLPSVVAMRTAVEGEGGWFVNLDTGAEVYFLNAAGSDWTRHGDLLSLQAENGYGYIDEAGNWVLEPEYAWTDDFYGSYGLVQRTQRSPYELIDASGQTVLFAGGDVGGYVVNGSVYWVANDEEGRIAKICDQNLQSVDLPAVGGRFGYAQNALTWSDSEGSRWFWDGTSVYAYPDDTLTLENCTAGRALFSWSPESGPRWYGLYDTDHDRWIMELAQEHSYLFQVDGNTYLGKGNNMVYNLDGKEICSGDWIGTPVDGVFPVVDGSWTGLRNSEGEWVLRLPLDTIGD